MLATLGHLSIQIVCRDERWREVRQQRAAGGGLEHTVLLGSTATDRLCGDVQGSEDFWKRFHLILT